MNRKRMVMSSALAWSATATVGAVALSGAQATPELAEAARTYACTAEITYQPSSGAPETYTKAFVLAPGEVFIDDFSTPTRQHTFSASATSQGRAVVIEAEYFSDVSALSWIDETASVTLQANDRREETSGRHAFSTSNGPAYTLTYRLTCERR